MTAYASGNIPSNVNTIERLHLWTALILIRNNPTLAILENADASPQKAVQGYFYRAADNTLRFTARATLQIDDTYATQTRKFWENALELTNTAIPTGFTTN